jgi:hypothetical protein
MTSTYPSEANRRLRGLRDSLQVLISRDPEQEVQGIAVPVVAAALNDIKTAKPHDPVVQSVVDLFSAEQIGTGDPIRAADLLVVVDQLAAAIGRPPPVVA